MTNPFTFPLDSAFDKIDYSLLEACNNDFFPQGNMSPLSIEAPPLLINNNQTKSFDMDLEVPREEEEFQYYENYSFFPEENQTYQEIIQQGPEAFQGMDFFEEIPIKQKITLYIEIDDEVYESFKKRQENGLEEEDNTSVSTKETLIGVGHSTMSLCLEGTLEGSPLSPECEWNQAFFKFVQKRPSEEKNYLKKVSPYLMDSLKQAMVSHQSSLPIPNLFESILSDLLYGKEMIMSKENELIKNLVNDELEKIRNYRPKEITSPFDLPMKKKKPAEKKSTKGKKNHSALNHMNENFVSNVFRFSKDSYPEDKDLQRLASERGVSATNFRNLTTAKLDDDIFVRKAKVRIVASGKELVSNIEYWMNGGYFENCDEKEKYLQYKQKAMCNLALDRMY